MSVAGASVLLCHVAKRLNEFSRLGAAFAPFLRSEAGLAACPKNGGKSPANICFGKALPRIYPLCG